MGHAGHQGWREGSTHPGPPHAPLPQKEAPHLQEQQQPFHHARGVGHAQRHAPDGLHRLPPDGGGHVPRVLGELPFLGGLFGGDCLPFGGVGGGDTSRVYWVNSPFGGVWGGWGGGGGGRLVGGENGGVGRFRRAGLPGVGAWGRWALGELSLYGGWGRWIGGFELGSGLVGSGVWTGLDWTGLDWICLTLTEPNHPGQPAPVGQPTPVNPPPSVNPPPVCQPGQPRLGHPTPLTQPCRTQPRQPRPGRSTRSTRPNPKPSHRRCRTRCCLTP